MLNERGEKKKVFRVYLHTLNRNLQKRARAQKREERHTNNAHTSKMADAEAKPVVEFTKVRLLQNNNQILFF